MRCFIGSSLRVAQLEDFARRRGKDTVAALDEALAEYLEWEQQDYVEAVNGIREGLDDVKAGRTQPASVFRMSIPAAARSPERWSYWNRGARHPERRDRA